VITAERRARDLLQQRHHLGAALGVERRGWLVGKDQRRLVGQRAADRHALLLAAGQVGGQRIGAGRSPTWSASMCAHPR
jgi:hypothetical protein